MKRRSLFDTAAATLRANGKWLALALLLFSFVQPGNAAEKDRQYPTRPIRFVVPFPPGGSYDVIARIVAADLSERLGQQVVVDNRPGAGGIIGTELIAKAPPDGYTIGMFGNPQTIAVNVNPNVAFDVVRDFTPIASVAVLANVITVHPSVPAKSLKELIEIAKARPGMLNYGSGGIGATSHLAGELLKSSAGINITHVPYTGAARALLDLLAGRIHLMVANMVVILPHVKSGKLRALAVASQNRSSFLSDVPTADEAGLKAFEFSQWYGIVTPRNVPQNIVTKLNSEISSIANSPKFREALTHQGAEPFVLDRQSLIKFIKDDVEKYQRIVKGAGISPVR